MKEIIILSETNEIQVRDMETNHYEVYNSSMKERFINEVDEHDEFINAIEWDV